MGLIGQTTLVTGGAGFIGGCLVEELLLHNARVVVVDKEVNSRSFFALNGFVKKTELVIADIRNRKKVLSIFKRYEPTYVIHLAAEPLVSQGYDNPYQTFETNIMGTVHILEAARENSHIKGVIVASSDKAYGKTIKPLYLFLDKEVFLYAKLKGLKFKDVSKKKNKLDDFIDDLEKKHPELKHSVVNSYLEMFG